MLLGNRVSNWTSGDEKIDKAKDSRKVAVFDLPENRCNMKSAIEEAMLFMDHYFEKRPWLYNQTNVEVVDTETRENHMFEYTPPHRFN